MTEDRAPATAGRTPWHFWLVAVLALLAALGGAIDYILTKIEYTPYLAMFPADQIAYFLAMPLWKEAVWTAAVWVGVLAAVLFILRRAWAVPAFVAALAFSVAFTATCLTDPVMRAHLLEPATLASAVVMLVIGLLLILYARAMRRRGVLR